MTETSPVEALFFAALEKGTPEERAAYLDAACGNDLDLRRRVERLLAAQPQVGSFLQATSDRQPAAPAAGVTAAYHGPVDAVGSLIAGKYKLLEALGEGGMGTVFMAQQTEPVKRLVALKVIKPGMDSRQVLARFEAERQALALMDHPNIAKVLDAGATAAGLPYFVMELVKGVPLTRFCDQQNLSPRERLELFVPVCQAIQHAHTKGIIHRDIKPSNVLVALYDDRPVPKVIDFGIAKAAGQHLTDATLVTGFGAVLGTPEYMSPEQAQLNQLDIDTRSDVYALGVLLYELLTGTTPIDRKRLGQAAMLEILRLIREEEPPRPSTRLSTSEGLASIAACRKTEPGRLAKLLRGELDWIVMKCLEKDRSRRYETANGLARDLDRFLHDEPVEAGPPAAAYRLRKFIHRNQGRVLAATVLAAMLLTVVGLVLYGVWWAERQSAERRHEQALLAARNNDAYKATLKQIEAALKAGRLAEAATLVKQADKQTNEQAPPDLRERHKRLRRDERTVRELENIFEERWMVSPTDTRIDNQRAKKRYPRLFQAYGLAVGNEPAAATVAKVRQSVIAEALSSGMTEWFFVDPKYAGLLAVVDLLDPKPARANLRAAIAAGDRNRMAQLAKTIDGSQLSAAYAIGLGLHPGMEDSLRILKAAWTAHPDSLPLALTISSQLFEYFGSARKAEAVGWGRTAVALGPNNPLAHYHYAVALSGLVGRENGANVADELYRTIQLAPRFAKAYDRLAFVLWQRGGPTAKAVAAARKAIKLDEQTSLAHFVLYGDLLHNKKDYGGAARLFRRLSELRGRRKEGSVPSDDITESFIAGYLVASFEYLINGLIRAERPFEAYCLILDNPHSVGWGMIRPPGGDPDESLNYSAACVAAMAGTGQGLDAPPPTKRRAIRKHALEWLNSSFDIWNKHATALSILGVRTVGLVGSSFGHGPLLAASAFFAGRPDAAADPASNRRVVHKGMNHWLSDSKLARIRDDQWLAKLPADEREQWRKLWGKIRSLRDRTAPSKTVPMRRPEK